MYPPMIFNTPTNMREGVLNELGFLLGEFSLNPRMVVLSQGLLLVDNGLFFTGLFELGFHSATCLNWLMTRLDSKPDAIFLFGMCRQLKTDDGSQTIFFR